MNSIFLSLCSSLLWLPYVHSGLHVFTEGTYADFVPHDENQTCSQDTHTTPFNTQLRGVNLGGWLVLEPWITPSLFYQFLGAQRRWGDKAPEKTALDIYTFCKALGSKEANRQLRIHWKKFVTEEDFERLYGYGVNSIRIPVGDWMFVPYHPYINCTDGAVEELSRAISLANKYNMTVLIDIHGHRDSQNGFDNSGQTRTVKWTSVASSLPIGTTTFEHWPIRTAEWMGDFDPENKNYSSINYENIESSLTAVRRIVEMYKDHPAVLGLEPINEPWELTPLDLLKQFYWEGYKIVKSIAPHWKYVMHDSFRFGLGVWQGFMAGCPDIALDTHIYQAWISPGSKEDYFSNACQQAALISKMEQDVMPVIVGEWSLATDNCAMWLNGFNDNLPGFPKVQCHYIQCPESYLGADFPGQLDRTRPIMGPYGTGISGPSFGECPVTSSNFFKGISDHEMFVRLGRKKLKSFMVGHGYYFWNFKTELDIKWDFMRSVEVGYLPSDVSSSNIYAEIESACERENKGDFICRAKRGVSDRDLLSGFYYACNQTKIINCTGLEAHYPKLIDRCDYVFNVYWHAKRIQGATCDFGGAASLVNPIGAQLPPLPFYKSPKEPKRLIPSSRNHSKMLNEVQDGLSGLHGEIRHIESSLSRTTNLNENNVLSHHVTMLSVVCMVTAGVCCALLAIYRFLPLKRRQYISLEQ